MATSKVEICNLALIRLNSKLITSLDESNQEARLCNILYPRLLEEMLRSHAWNFATRREYLAQLDAEYNGFEYAYSYPSDCLMARYIVNPVNLKDEVLFEVHASKDLSSKVILTDQDSAELVYTAYVKIPSMFDPLFVDAFSLLLGSRLAVALQGKHGYEQTLYQQHLMKLESAKATDSQEGKHEVIHSNTFVEARN